MKFFGSIYLIVNKLNHKIYVGQTIGNLKNRFDDHYTKKSNSAMYNAMRKYGRENFQIVELDKAFTSEELNNKEIFYISEFNSLSPRGYNLRSGGGQGHHLSEESKRKISKTKTGIPNLKKRGELRNEEYRLKISRTLGGQQIIGTNEKTGETLILQTSHEGTKYGFQPWNIIACCKGRRPRHKGFTFKYYANQNGSSENKETEHVQRIGIETTKK